MTTSAIITIVAVVLLIIIGASQREKIKTIIRSESKEFLDKKINTIKVANLKLFDLETKIRNLVDDAGNIFAEIKAQKKNLESLKKKTASLLKKAQKSKLNGKDDEAKEYIKLHLVSEEQVGLVEENLKLLESNKDKLELAIQKLKSIKEVRKIKISGLEAKKATVIALQSISNVSVDDNSLDATIENIDDSISKDEYKLEYTESIEEVEDVNYSDEIEAKFAELEGGKQSTTEA